ANEKTVPSKISAEAKELNATVDVPQTAVPDIPPQPALKALCKGREGIILQWKIPSMTHLHAKIRSFEIHMFKERQQGTIDPPFWMKVDTEKSTILWSEPLTSWVKLAAIATRPGLFIKQHNGRYQTFQYEWKGASLSLI
ncbi:hypothetical protein TNIN_205461, partial [Trichonephila inaurata madagascariensis]